MSKSVHGQKRASLTGYEWGRPTSDAEVQHRASGRRKYNAIRQFHASLRRKEVAEAVIESGGLPWGAQRRLAEQFGVSEATISRDIRRLMVAGSVSLGRRCPLCMTRLNAEDPEWEPEGESTDDEC